MSVHVLIAIVVVALVLAPGEGRAQGRQRGVVVRVYDTVPASAVERRASLDVARSILSDADLAVTWLVCGGRSARQAVQELRPCYRFLAPGELIVRIVTSRRPAGTPGRLPLGDAFVDEAGLGVLATAYVDRIARVAESAGSDQRVLLGRVLAHEIGHLLLGTNEHGGRGLMRAAWSRDDLRRGRTEDWRFTPLERELMRVDGATVAMVSSP